MSKKNLFLLLEQLIIIIAIILFYDHSMDYKVYIQHVHNTDLPILDYITHPTFILLTKFVLLTGYDSLIFILPAIFYNFILMIFRAKYDKNYIYTSLFLNPIFTLIIPLSYVRSSLSIAFLVAGFLILNKKYYKYILLLLSITTHYSGLLIISIYLVIKNELNILLLAGLVLTIYLVGINTRPEYFNGTTEALGALYRISILSLLLFFIGVNKKNLYLIFVLLFLLAMSTVVADRVAIIIYPLVIILFTQSVAFKKLSIVWICAYILISIVYYYYAKVNFWTIDITA
jgi:hypothetical protein